jgi:hypothetical protein
MRLISQQISGTRFQTVKEIVGWMGAIQAQDYSMSKWAIGTRLPNSTEEIIDTAIDNGDILRTHLLRPTWHFVSSDDIYWMLELAAPQIKASLKSRHKELELSEAICNRSNTLIEKALSRGNHLTREEILTELKKAKISLDNNRASHLLLRAELDQLICSGSTKANKKTYALLEERVPKGKPITRNEGLALLAQKYFSSHGPATLQDFVWWSGLSVADSKQALEMVKNNFTSETIKSRVYWFSPSLPISKTNNHSLCLLPAFDEFIISYKDRIATLSDDDHKKSISNNGIFRPVIVWKGQVIGIWKRTSLKDKIFVEAEFFNMPGKEQEFIEKATSIYGNFLQKKALIRNTS